MGRNEIVMLIDDYAKLREEKRSPSFSYVQDIHNTCTGGYMDGQRGAGLKEAEQKMGWARLAD